MRETNQTFWSRRLFPFGFLVGNALPGCDAWLPLLTYLGRYVARYVKVAWLAYSLGLGSPSDTNR